MRGKRNGFSGKENVCLFKFQTFFFFLEISRLIINFSFI